MAFVAPAAQDTPEPSTTEEQAAAAAPSRPPEEGARDSAGSPPSDIRTSFFAMLQDLVSAGPMNSKKPSRLFGNRTDVMARLLTLARSVDDGGNPALYQQAYLAARLWNPIRRSRAPSSP